MGTWGLGHCGNPDPGAIDLGLGDRHLGSCTPNVRVEYALSCNTLFVPYWGPLFVIFRSQLLNIRSQLLNNSEKLYALIPIESRFDSYP